MEKFLIFNPELQHLTNVMLVALSIC